VAKNGQATINAMQFSSSFRLITGERGNLYKEMQMFKRLVLPICRRNTV
jgi:hypothetical protein